MKSSHCKDLSLDLCIYYISRKKNERAIRETREPIRPTFVADEEVRVAGVRPRRRRIYGAVYTGCHDDGCHDDLDSVAVGDVGVSDAPRAAADVRLTARHHVPHDRQTPAERRRRRRRTGTGNDVTGTGQRRCHRGEVVQRQVDSSSGVRLDQPSEHSPVDRPALCSI